MTEHVPSWTDEEKQLLQGIAPHQLEGFQRFLESLPDAGVLYVLSTEERDRNDYNHPMVKMARAEYNKRMEKRCQDRDSL